MSCKILDRVPGKEQFLNKILTTCFVSLASFLQEKGHILCMKCARLKQDIFP